MDAKVTIEWNDQTLIFLMKNFSMDLKRDMSFDDSEDGEEGYQLGSKYAVIHGFIEKEAEEMN